MLSKANTQANSCGKFHYAHICDAGGNSNIFFFNLHINGKLGFLPSTYRNYTHDFTYLTDVRQ